MKSNKGKKSKPAALTADYRRRVYAGWLGKCIGVRLGAPIEGWTYQAIRDNLGEITGYLPQPPGKIFKPDDDTAMPLILLRGLQDYGPGITASQLGDTWLNYLGDQRGTLWWGGYGVSTEHTAYLNLASGVPSPLSGSIELNGAAIAEQIGGQIFSDIWGLVCPNRPELAADYAQKASSVSHDGNGMYGGRFIAALVSAAFSEREPLRLVQAGLQVIPKNCEYARVVNAMGEFHQRNPDDWHAAYQYLLEHFGYDRYPGVVHIIPNAGVIALGLLYGAGDFSRTILITTMCGWDTDCNAGNAGAILGVAQGLDGIAASWRAPMEDILVGASLIGARNLTDMAACADLITSLGESIAGQAATLPVNRYHFNYPGSTQGFCAEVDEKRGSLVDLRQEPQDEGGALRAVFKKLNKKGEARIFARTCLHPADLSANFYGASFSPRLYPGQSLRARIMASGTTQPVSAAAYAWDENLKKIQGAVQTLTPGIWQELTLTLPHMHAARIAQAGIVLRNQSDDLWNGSILVAEMDWSGAAQFSDDFSHARPEAGSISGWTYLRGYWRLEGGGYHGSGAGINESYTGDVAWQDYSYRVHLAPLSGRYHNINFRVQGALRSYALGLAPEDRLVLYKNDKGYHKLTETPFPWEFNQRYTLWARMKGNQIEAGSGDQLLLSWTDSDEPYLHGQVGLSNFAGCHTRYEMVEVG